MTFFKETLRPVSMLAPSFEEFVGWHSCEDLDDSSLDNCASAIHAGRMSNDNTATSKWGTDTRRVCDGVEFSVAEPEILFGPGDASFIFVRRAASRSAVIPNRSNLERRAEDKSADLGTLVFREFCDRIDDPHVLGKFVFHQSPPDGSDAGAGRILTIRTRSSILAMTSMCLSWAFFLARCPARR